MQGQGTATVGMEYVEGWKTWRVGSRAPRPVGSTSYKQSVGRDSAGTFPMFRRSTCWDAWMRHPLGAPLAHRVQHPPPPPLTPLKLIPQTVSRNPDKAKYELRSIRMCFDECAYQAASPGNSPPTTAPSSTPPWTKCQLSRHQSSLLHCFFFPRLFAFAAG